MNFLIYKYFKYDIFKYITVKYNGFKEISIKC